MIYTGNNTFETFRDIRRERGVIGYWDGFFYEVCRKIVSVGVYVTFIESQTFARNQKKKKLVRKLSDYNIICDICCEQNKEHTFDPCGHCSCSNCLPKIQSRGTECPFCRKNINKVVKIYI